MNKAVLISINPEGCELIANGKKTIEVRKTRPKIDTPFKCYIYCTKGSPYLNSHNGKLYLEANDTLGGKGFGLYKRLSGKVIGEFVCDEIQGFEYRIQTPEDATSWQDCYEGYASDLYFMDGTMLSRKEIDDYGAGKFIYTWHISDLVIYDNPKELREFKSWVEPFTWDFPEPITKAPQSWRYVEELL